MFFESYSASPHSYSLVLRFFHSVSWYILYSFSFIIVFFAGSTPPGNFSELLFSLSNGAIITRFSYPFISTSAQILCEVFIIFISDYLVSAGLQIADCSALNSICATDRIFGKDISLPVNHLLSWISKTNAKIIYTY